MCLEQVFQQIFSFCSSYSKKHTSGTIPRTFPGPQNSKFQQQMEVVIWGGGLHLVWVLIHKCFESKWWDLLLGCWDWWSTKKADMEAFSSTTLSFVVWGEVRNSCSLFAQKKEFSNTASPTGSSSSRKTLGKVCLPEPSTFTVSMDWRVTGSLESVAARGVTILEYLSLLDTN